MHSEKIHKPTDCLFCLLHCFLYKLFNPASVIFKMNIITPFCECICFIFLVQLLTKGIKLISSRFLNNSYSVSKSYFFFVNLLYFTLLYFTLRYFIFLYFSDFMLLLLLLFYLAILDVTHILTQHLTVFEH